MMHGNVNHSLYCSTHLFQCTNTSLTFPEDGQTQRYKSKFPFPKKLNKQKMIHTVSKLFDICNELINCHTKR